MERRGSSEARTESCNEYNTVGVQSWKAAHLPTLEFRVEQGGIVPVGSEGRPWPRTVSTTSSSRLLMHTEMYGTGQASWASWAKSKLVAIKKFC